jgi:hypothetical protein
VSSSTESARAAQRLGFAAGQVVQEFGYDEDAAVDLRADLEERVEVDLVGEDYDDVTDGALVWYRADDDDLSDILMDALGGLDDNGPVWVLTPKAGRPGHVPPSDVEDAASTCGMHVISTFAAAADWSATRLSSRGRGK